MKWKVEQSESGVNLLSFLKSKLPENYSVRQLKRALDSGACELNGRIERFGSKHVGVGDVVSFKSINISSKQFTKIDPTAILYEDEDILAYNKPAGLVSDSKETLDAFQLYHPRLEIVHRLDKDTTGILLFAKNERAKEALFKSFREREVVKTYHALVDNNCKEPEGIIENYLGKIGHFHGQTLWGKVDKKRGSLAITKWYCERQLNHAALVRCLPLTGRTHQIRVHMKDSGHPILGDYQYSKQFKCTYKPERCLLHASQVEFMHPITNTKIQIKSPLPEDFKKIMDQMD